jgi:uncharacterized membrane protein
MSSLPHDTSPPETLPSPPAEPEGALLRAMRRIENDPAWDPLVRTVTAVARPLGQSPAAPILRGEWLGHALHPLLTDFPLGCWIASGFLDLLPGKAYARASQQLVGLGLVAVPATVAAGLADYTTTDEPEVRRVAAVHGVGNAIVALLYLRSWLARRAGHPVRGRVYGLSGGLVAWGTGYLGGHLSLARGVGQGVRTRRAA